MKGKKNPNIENENKKAEKKAKKKWSKKKKAGVSCLVIVLLAAITAFIFVFPKIYLVQKYDSKINDYSLVDFKPGYYAYDIDYWSVVWKNIEWKYRCGKTGREFGVTFFDFQFYDDYQLEEVEQWLLEEMQKNVDKNIDCIDVASGAVYGVYNENKNTVKNVVWDCNNTKNLLNNWDQISIYVYCNDFEQYLNYPVESNHPEVGYYNYNNKNENYNKYIDELESKLNNTYDIDYPEITIHKNKLVISREQNFYGVYYGNQPVDYEMYLIKN